MHRTLYSLGALSLLLLAGCADRPKPIDRRGSFDNSTAKSSHNSNDTLKTSETPVELILDSTKLLTLPGAYKAEISFQAAEASVSQALGSLEVMPAGKDTRLALSSVPAQVNGLLTVALYQDKTLKFIVKRANTNFAKDAKSLVIDDCLVLPAPWDGIQNNGSCEWSIEDVAN